MDFSNLGQIKSKLRRFQPIIDWSLKIIILEPGCIYFFKLSGCDEMLIYYTIQKGSITVSNWVDIDVLLCENDIYQKGNYIKHSTHVAPTTNMIVLICEWLYSDSAERPARSLLTVSGITSAPSPRTLPRAPRAAAGAHDKCPRHT